MNLSDKQSELSKLREEKEGFIALLHSLDRRIDNEEISAIYTAQNAGRSVNTLVSQELRDGDSWQTLIIASDTKSYMTGISNTITTRNLNCSTLLQANQIYTLRNNITVNSATCFNINVQNVTIDCNGYSITGTNTSNTYGVYSNQINTTIKNCNINNFDSGINFNGATYGTIENTNTSTTKTSGDWEQAGCGITLNNGANYNTIKNSNAYASVGMGLLIHASKNNAITNFTANTGYKSIFIIRGNADNNILINVTGNSSTQNGIEVYDNGRNNQIINSTGISAAMSGMVFSGASSNNTITNSQIKGVESTVGALSIYSGSYGNTVANSTINGLGGTYAVVFSSGATTNNRFINNTLMNATTLLYIDTSASANTFYWNNFTNTAGSYVNDLNGNNYYNTTIDGKNQGNIYENVITGLVNINGLANSSITGLHIGTSGSGYPYNNANSLNKVTGVTDYAPLTPFSNSAPTISSISILPQPAYTNESLRGYCNATDIDNNTLQYYHQWYLNNVANASGNIGRYAQGTQINIANISSNLLAVGQNWTLSCKVDDGIINSSWTNSSTITIQPLIPAIPTLISPTNNNYMVRDRQPTFIWSTTTPEITTWYEINLTSNHCAAIHTNQTNILPNGGNYTPAVELYLQTECTGNSYYNWTIRACNVQACSNKSAIYNFSIEPYLAITLLNNNVTFQTLLPDETLNTTNNTPAPFIFQNDGNTMADLTTTIINQSMWTSAPLGSTYMQVMAQENETGAIDNQNSQTTWINAQTTNNNLIKQLNYKDIQDTTKIHIKITVPNQEPGGRKNIYITFNWI